MWLWTWKVLKRSDFLTDSIKDPDWTELLLEPSHGLQARLNTCRCDPEKSRVDMTPVKPS